MEWREDGIVGYEERLEGVDIRGIGDTVSENREEGDVEVNEVGVVFDQEETRLDFGFSKVEVGHGLELEEEGAKVEEEFVEVDVNEEVKRDNKNHNIRELEELGWFGFGDVSKEIVKSLTVGEEVNFI